jgi:hypothetical protein
MNNLMVRAIGATAIMGVGMYVYGGGFGLSSPSKCSAPAVLDKVNDIIAYKGMVQLYGKTLTIKSDPPVVVTVGTSGNTTMCELHITNMSVSTGDAATDRAAAGLNKLFSLDSGASVPPQVTIDYTVAPTDDGQWWITAQEKLP